MIDRLPLPATLENRAGPFAIRRADMRDLPALMQLLSDDAVSASRGDVAAHEDEPAYHRALADIIEDSRNEVVVAVEDDRIVGTFQLTLIPGLARRGTTRLLVEAVRVASDSRSVGTGSALMRWVMDVAALEVGAALVQLTSDAARGDAHRFYLRLGFLDSHMGFKYRIDGGE